MRALHFAVRPRVLAAYVGQMLVAFAGLTAVPAIVAWIDGRPDVAVRYLIVILVVGLGGGLAASRAPSSRLQANEALVVSALVFILPALATSFVLSAYDLSPLDALFEAVSGLTTTGLSTLATVGDRPVAFHFARAWLQWVGGLGVVVLALAFVIPSGVAAKQLGFDDREATRAVGGTRAHARRMLVVYLALTVGGIALCLGVGMTGFDALVHTLAAISTGGFAPADDSLAGLGVAARTVVSLICLAGAVSFAVYYQASARTLLRAWPVWTLLVLTAGASALAGSFIAVDASPGGDATWTDGAWLAISAQTSAGFSTVPVGELPPAAKLTLIVSMLIGGQLGSTAGGIKILRFLLLVRLVQARLHRLSLPPRAHVPLRIDGIRVGRTELENVIAFLTIYMTMALLGWVAFLAHGHAPLDALFDVVSALGTVGLSAGTVGPDTAPLLKALLCGLMIMGARGGVRVRHPVAATNLDREETGIMRVIFVGASPLALHAAKALTGRGHDVVLIEANADKVEALSDEMDCGLIVGDGSRPAVLREVDPRDTDTLFCLSDRDEANILAALVGRSLGFGRVVPKIEDAELQPICAELGLSDVIVPDREVAVKLVDVVEGREIPELTAAVSAGLRFLSLVVPSDVTSVEGLALPGSARAIVRTRGEHSELADDGTRLEEGDEVVVIVEDEDLEELRTRFADVPDEE